MMQHNPLCNSRAQATHHRAILDGDDAVVVGSGFLQDFLIDGLEKNHVIVSHVDALFLEAINYLDDGIADVANTQDSHALTLAHATSTPDGQCVHLVVPVGDDTLATRVADGKGTMIVVLGSEHQVA